MLKLFVFAALVSLTAAPAFADKLAVKFLSGKVLELEVKPADTVGSVKQQLQDKEGIPPEQQRVIHAGKELMDGQTLADCGIKDGGSVNIVLRQRGG